MHVEIPKAIELEQQVFNICNENELHSIALEVFRFQYAENRLYRDYCNALGREPSNTANLSQVPFLPIAFFKSHEVTSGAFVPEVVFESSGTTGITPSRHYLKSATLYVKSFSGCFQQFYGDIKDYCILALLPSYLERGQSSLVYMADHLIRNSVHPDSGFYLRDLDRLYATLQKLEKAEQKTILIGVSYALLEFAKQFPVKLSHTIVMETGGMKGRHREITRNELYEELRTAFALEEIHSEYGMTELLSQAYAVNGRFRTPPWMKVLGGDETDPFHLFYSPERPTTGVLHVVDLANIYSCSFIATQDVGRFFPDGSFEVVGRMDHSDIRGCSLMAL